MASSSSSSANVIRPHKYAVFLSFRGTDTRNGFLGHLYRALTAKGIKTYIDEETLERGDEIAYSLVEAIHDSKASIVVLSENYASSWWCLDELVHIIQCKDRNGLIVVPVFYHVEPTHVRKQEGKFGDAFSKLKLSERFKDDEEKLDSWTTALSRISDLSGWDSSVIRSEAVMLDEIVKDVKRKLERNSRPSRDSKGLVGIEERVEKIKSLLRIINQGTRIVGIWGMGGIGKTTLAKEVFNELCSEFEGCCFIDNVRGNWENGKEEILRNKLHSKLLDEENPYNVEERLSNKQVLIVLDDVNDQEQLEFLLDDCNYFGNGSRVIVTTRDMQMLRYLDADDALYKVEGLNRHEALELFVMTAFRSQPHTDLDTELINRVLRYAQGVPLAIKVLGSYLRCKKKENWGVEMDKLERSPNDKIQNVLKISYDGLDEMNKQIFLDIACFLEGEFREDVEKVLDGCGFYAKAGIDDLIDKSLITISSTTQLWMHDLILEMGRKIVNSTQKHEKRSRLWNAEEVVRVLKSNIGSEAIEGIFLDMDKIGELDLSPDVFKPMHDLRYLRINDCEIPKLHFPLGLHALPDALRYLSWNYCSLKSFSSKFTPRNLVELDMSNSQLCELWNGVQDLANLKTIDLSYSEKLTRIPDLSLAPNLESVYLYNCTSLVQIPPFSFQTPEQHASKNYSRHALSGSLDLDGCSNLESLPKISGYIERLNLSNTKVRELSTTTVSLDNLATLLLKNCSLSHLPCSICLMEYLTFIDLSDSSLFNKFPEELPMNIVSLDFSGTEIKYLPLSIEHVCGTLESFYLDNCKRLETLPTNFYKMKKLMRLTLRGCSNLEEFPEKLPPNLVDLYVSRCTSLARVSNSETLEQVHWIDYGNWKMRRFLFCECLKLSENARYNILIEYQIRVLLTAIMSSVCKTDSDVITTCLPGNEIPEWFNCRSEEPSITINLPENWHTTEFIGFALCISATFEESNFKLDCEYYYRNIENSPSPKLRQHIFSNNIDDYYRKEEVIKSDHLFMWSIEKNHQNNLDAVKITFELEFSHYHDQQSPCNNKVRRCGVHLLSWEDAAKFGVYRKSEPA